MRWKLFEMRNITTLAMLRGLVVHQVIAEALGALRDGDAITLDAARGRVTEIMREKLRESYYKAWHIDNRPRGSKASQFTNLLEHYYGFPDTDQRARENRAVGLACVGNLLESEFWASIADTDPENWKAMEDEGFPSFDLDGIKVYARIDFAHSDGSTTIIDWKTGASSDEDRRQLTLYSLFAQWKWGWDPLETKLAAVYLQPEFRVDDFRPAPEDIDDVNAFVKRSFNEMLEIEPAYEKADIKRFPLTDNIDNCHWCRFRGVCEGAARAASP